MNPAHTTADSCCDAHCLGTLFPDLLHLETNKTNKGHVYGIRIESYGIGVHRREVTVDEEALAHCQKSPHFDRCLHLSMARLMLQQAALRF